MKNSEIKIRISEDRKISLQKEASSKGISLTELIMKRIDVVPTNVPTKGSVPTNVATTVPTKAEKVGSEEVSSVHTSVATKGIGTDGWASGLVEVAHKLGTREDWKQTNDLLGGQGYKYEIATRTLSQGKRVVKLSSK